MRIYVDVVTLLPTAEVWDRAQVIAPSAKRGDGDPLELQFHRSGVPERLPVGTVITFILKTQGRFDQNPALVELQLGDANRPATDTDFYTGEPDYNTGPLNTAFASGDADDTNDLPIVLADGEVSWLLSAAGSKPKSTQRFTVTVTNDVKKGNEGLPTDPAPTYLTAAESDARYAALGTTAPHVRLEITTLTGGGATALDGIASVGVSVPRVYLVILGGSAKMYLLHAGNAAEAAPGIIRPDDHAPSTNEKILTQIS